MKRQQLSLAVLLIAFLFSLHVFAQSERQEAEIIEDNANACELNGRLIDLLKLDAANTNEKVTVVFRAGDGETPAFNSKRLAVMREYLVKNKGWNNEQDFILTRGKKVKGQGRIEFYLGERLYWTAMVKRGKFPCMACCWFDFEKGRF